MNKGKSILDTIDNPMDNKEYYNSLQENYYQPFGSWHLSHSPPSKRIGWKENKVTTLIYNSQVNYLIHHKRNTIEYLKHINRLNKLPKEIRYYISWIVLNEYNEYLAYLYYK